MHLTGLALRVWGCDCVRVLWFTSVMPAAVSTHLGTTGSVGAASWVESLRQVLAGRDDLDLAIASPCPTFFASFSADGVTHYGMPVPGARGRIGRAVTRWQGSPRRHDPDSIIAGLPRIYGGVLS